MIHERGMMMTLDGDKKQKQIKRVGRRRRRVLSVLKNERKAILL